jgi:biotin carboxyl carrier protein
MRRFVVNVNGKQYEVDVEELAAGAAAPAPAPAPVAAAPAPTPAPAAPKAAPAPAAVASGKPVVSPMPGTIVDIKFKVGDSVKRGDILAILEAMKMENEITCDTDGVVTSVATSKGSSINTGEVILTIG